ncbi:hypothetical protein UA08_01115 [Talaromyces atroroseus]|uniref:Proteasome assembly chaperone 4 n=1 Tax=Talaromyces atroroseus TaxID=1441469 RepID=A0A225B2B1_TALAT|nr:hypothetical protein UA08_01115 [Talaromyces atroroseus]OKL63858.1 hypothetical protein UA08_01115 [Talaromyces atroroseus]
MATAALPSLKPVEISFPLPKTPHTNVHIHLTFMATSTMVFLSTTTLGDSGSTLKPMGSLIYAMPDRTNPQSTISTVLYTSPGSIDYATRTARILARRMKIPVYVGCNIDPVVTGSTVEEEMEGFSKIIDTIMKKWESRE